jgi:hypothetical protein
MEPALTIYDWIKLPVRVQPRDVISVGLTEDEIATINDYGDRMFDKATIDKMSSQWSSSKGLNKKNPNSTGIKGEYAGLKYFSPETPLSEFLNDRPWKMSDMGDAIIKGKKAKIFDFKTRTRSGIPVEMLVDDDGFMAEMDNKFSDRNKYGYLQAFIFCVNDEKYRRVLLMGWLSADEFFEYAQLITRGNPVPQSWRPYVADVRLLPYRRLRPMSELKGLPYYSITQDVTLNMKEAWHREHVKELDIDKYIPQLQIV